MAGIDFPAFLKGGKHMSKVVDITEKLSFDTNPVLKVKGESIEVQSDAETILKIMGLFGEGKNEVEAAVGAANLIFSEKDQKKIAKMGLQMKDYMILVQEAMNLAMDGEEDGGEQ